MKLEKCVERIVLSCKRTSVQWVLWWMSNLGIGPQGSLSQCQEAVLIKHNTYKYTTTCVGEDGGCISAS